METTMEHTMEKTMEKTMENITEHVHKILKKHKKLSHQLDKPKIQRSKSDKYEPIIPPAL